MRRYLGALQAVLRREYELAAHAVATTIWHHIDPELSGHTVIPVCRTVGGPRNFPRARARTP